MLLSPEAACAVATLAKAIPAFREERKALGLMLEVIASLWNCPRGTIFLHKRSADRLYEVKSLSPGEGGWDAATVARFFRNEKPLLAPNVIMAPVRAGQDVVGVLALAGDAPLQPGAGKVATEILRIAGGILGIRRQAAVLEAETSVARAMLRGLAAKDVAYRIFHEVSRFVGYDHGATLVRRMGKTSGRVVARALAWQKGKSNIIEQVIPAAFEHRPPGHAIVLDGPSWDGPWAWLSAVREGDSPPKASIVVVVLEDRGQVVGCAEVSSRSRGFFKQSDADLLDRFRPHLAWCLKAVVDSGEPAT